MIWELWLKIKIIISVFIHDTKFYDMLTPNQKVNGTNTPTWQQAVNVEYY